LNFDVVTRHLNNSQVGSIIGWRLEKLILNVCMGKLIRVDPVLYEGVNQYYYYRLKSVKFKKGSDVIRLEGRYCIQITRTKKDTTLYFDNPNQPNNLR